MEGSLDLPIALRRTRRSLGKPAPCASPRRDPPEEPMPVRTPKSRKRRVRFSDPGPGPAATSGLTPMIRRTSLTTSRTPRRRSTPGRLSQPSNGSGIPEWDAHGSPFSGEVCFLPLRQVLDGRVVRRIRRNGLSEEMNAASTERRQRAQRTRAEIDRLKAELVERDEEIARLHDETVVLDTERVWDLEQQVEALKRELASRSDVQQAPSSPAYEWARMSRDPYSPGCMDLDMDEEDHQFGEATRAELLCSTPTRRMRASFPTPPATSPPPPEPQSPCRRFVTARPSIGIQASLPDPEKQRLEEELESLQLEVAKLTTTLESYSAFTARISDKLAAFTKHDTSEEPSPAPQSEVEVHLTSVIQTLSDRTAALSELDTSLKTLGFNGSDAFEVIDALRAGFRSARLELEYLTPGEITLPLTGAGAEVLDLTLARLRALAQKTRDADDCIDEYHALELSLRQQLTARVDAMDALADRLSAAERAGRDKDARIAELEVGIDRLKGAARSYTRDMAELEALVERMDGDRAEREAAVGVQEEEHRRATAALEEKLATALVQIAALQNELANLTAAHADTLATHKAELAALTTSHADELATRKAELATLTTTHEATLTAHKTELARSTQSHTTLLAQRDARVAELRSDLDRLNTSLREALDSLQKLRVDNTRLAREKAAAERQVAEEREKAKGVVDGMMAELERVVRMGEGFLGGSSVVTGEGGEGVVVVQGEDGEGQGVSKGLTRGFGVAASGDLVHSARGRKRRRYDSGLGLLDEEDEVEV